MNKHLFSKPELLTLRDQLHAWTNWDVAALALAQSLGLIQNDGTFWGGDKGLFWSDNPIGNTLYAILEQLTTLGILDRREEPDTQFRWNANFTATQSNR